LESRTPRIINSDRRAATEKYSRPIADLSPTQERESSEPPVPGSDDLTFGHSTMMSAHGDLLNLPLELLLKLLDILPASDTVSLLSTCRPLHVHARSDHVFAPLCARYGVYSADAFPTSYRSFYAVYTRLLHAFGPLIGLYASDSPYSGSILRLRYEEKDGNGEVHGQTGPGIVGEMWSFLHNPTLEALLEGDGVHDPWKVGKPVPRQLFRIGFPALDETDANDKVSEVMQEVAMHNLILCLESPAHAQVVCFRKRPENIHPAVLGLSPPRVSRRRIAMQIRREDDLIIHPDFPPAHSPWLDTQRHFHAVRLLTEDVFPSNVSRDAVLSRLEAFRREIYFKETSPEPGDALSRWHDRFISIHCECFGVDSPDSALLGPTRFYPIRSDVWTEPPRQDTPFVDPRPLRGLWMGDYGPHASEAIYIDVDLTTAGEHTGDRPNLKAMKLTGDFNVPRGVVSWEAYLDAEIEKDELLLSVRQGLLLEDDISEEAAAVRVFSGWGTISDAGFLYVTRSPG
jgi:hypothetical protein